MLTPYDNRSYGIDLDGDFFFYGPTRFDGPDRVSPSGWEKYSSQKLDRVNHGDYGYVSQGSCFEVQITETGMVILTQDKVTYL